MNKLRAVLIDPFARTVSEVELSPSRDGDYETQFNELRALVFPGDTVGRGLLTRVWLAKDAVGWGDDEGLLVDWDKQAFFRVPFYPTPLAGRMVLVGEDPETDTDYSLPPHAVDVMRAAVSWVEPKDVRVPAPTFQQCDDKMQPVGEPTPLYGGAREWTYDNQP